MCMSQLVLLKSIAMLLCSMVRNPTIFFTILYQSVITPKLHQGPFWLYVQVYKCCVSSVLGSLYKHREDTGLLLIAAMEYCVYE